MSETQKIGVFIDWHIPIRSKTGPGFAPVDHWAERLHEVCDSAIESALKTGSAHIEIKVLSKEIQLSRQNGGRMNIDEHELEAIITAAYERGANWAYENSSQDDKPYLPKAARDYADKTIGAYRIRRQTQGQASGQAEGGRA